MTEIPPSTPPGGSYTPPPPPPPGGPTGAPAGSDRTVMLVLSYLGLLALIPLIVKKDDREVQWHAKNGLFLFVAYIILIIAWTIINNFLPSSVGCALSFISCALWIGYLALCIMAIMKAVNGQRMRFPVISDMADK
jgi:uncharacterized membrane protein